VGFFAVFGELAKGKVCELLHIRFYRPDHEIQRKSRFARSAERNRGKLEPAIWLKHVPGGFLCTG